MLRGVRRAGAGARYCELNFSPSTEWAAYEFDGYRQGMRALALASPPRIAVAETQSELRVTASHSNPRRSPTHHGRGAWA